MKTPFLCLSARFIAHWGISRNALYKCTILTYLLTYLYIYTAAGTLAQHRSSGAVVTV